MPSDRTRLQRTRRWVTVVVVDTSTCDRETGVRRRDEVGILLRRTVVRNLEDVGAQIRPRCRQIACWPGGSTSPVSSTRSRATATMITRLLSFCMEDSS